MNMNLNLTGNLAQSQQLNLAPQLLQWLRLLQVSSQQLDQLVRTELETNPAIELDYETTDAPDEADIVSEERPDSLDDGLPELDERFELLAEIDSHWAEEHMPTCEGDIRAAQDRKDYQMQSLTDTPSLHESLLRQIAVAANPAHKTAAGMIAGMLDERGYLPVDLETLAAESGLPLADLESGLVLVHECEPAGVGARDLRECLMLQLPDDGATLNRDARAIVTDGLEALAQNRLDAIARHLGIDLDRVTRAAQRIRTLNPSPARLIADATTVTATITPDITIRHDGEGGFAIEIVEDSLPRLRISRDCRRLLERGDLSKTDIAFIRSRIRAASFLINGLEKRGSTLRRIAGEIVRAQHPYLRGEETEIRPLTMAKVAAFIGVHDTTVSRALAEKYVSTPVGIFPMKHFFKAGYRCDDGSSISPERVQRRVAAIIKAEDPAAPIKDEDIAARLSADGIPVARRTIAKYRGELDIPSSKQRAASSKVKLKVLPGGRDASIDKPAAIAMMG